MKKIVFTVTDEAASVILPTIIDQIHEITVTYEGPDPVDESALEAAITPIKIETKRKIHRGDKRAVDIVMEMFDEEDNPVRTNASIAKFLHSLGFAANTPSGTISKLVQTGFLRRLGRDAVQIVPEAERESLTPE